MLIRACTLNRSNMVCSFLMSKIHNVVLSIANGSLSYTYVQLLSKPGKQM